MALRLIILGLRRSGTTIFWKTLRQDERYRSFDEPMNPHLRYLPGQRPGEPIKHRKEFNQLIDEMGAEAFHARRAEIPFDEELDERLTDAQADWLRFLGDTAPHVMVDITRCQFKVPALAEVAPDAVVVHLHRSPASQVTSHLLPTTVRDRFTSRMRYRLSRLGFFTRKSGFDGWSFERIIGRDPGGPFGARLGQAGLDPEQVLRLPAAGKLLAYWRLAYERVESTGRASFGDRFVSVSFEAFCRRPREALEPVYAALGWELPELRLDEVRAAKPAYRHDDPRWERLARDVGLQLDGSAGE